MRRSPLVLKYNQALEKNFTVVVWDQRGAGKSYYPFAEDTSVTIETFLQDLYFLVQYLLERFRQEKLYLWGHSQGSVLGLYFIQRHLEYICTYIGCGQVVNMKKSCRIALEYAWNHANSRERYRLENINSTYTGENWLEELLFVTRLVVKYKGSLYGEHSYAKLAWPFLFSGLYSPADLPRHQKGSLWFGHSCSYTKVLYISILVLPRHMLMFGKDVSNRKHEINRQHHTIPNRKSQGQKDKHCGEIQTFFCKSFILLSIRHKNYEFFLNTTAVVLTSR